MQGRTRSTVRAALAATAGAALVLAGGPGAQAVDGHSPGGPRPPDRTTSAGTPVDLGALFIGAHPDDEAGTLSTIGQWGRSTGLKTGVVTVTRGEGGGNAVGPQEGPALGLLREREERRAVSRAGITDVFNLDTVDFYYTVSEPLTRELWGHDATLAKIVRVVRQTRPEVLLTMNPAPSPGNHGNHQEAARLAIEAFQAAADPSRFPDQITKEGLRAWAPAKVLRGGISGTSTTGPGCTSSFTPTDPSADVYGVWAGTPGPGGKTWAQIEREAQREYASQGWAGFPDAPSDPAQIGCDYFTQVDSRVPYPRMRTGRAARPNAVLLGATIRARGGLPLGTGLRAEAADLFALPGTPLPVTVSVTAPPSRSLRPVRLSLRAPQGWRVGTLPSTGTIAPGRTVTRTVSVTAPAGAEPGLRVKLDVRARSRDGRGYTAAPVRVSAPVTSQQQLLPQVAQFERWVDTVDRPALSGVVLPVLSLPSGGSRPVSVTVTNRSREVQSGRVSPTPPSGFSVTPASRSYRRLAPGASTRVSFTVTNTDTSLKTSNEGGAGGDYAWSITTTSNGVADVARGALELVPRTTISRATTAPKVDGVESPGEYPGATLDLSRRWEGDACTSAADCSARAKITWSGDTLYVVVHVADDVLGTRLDASDCKRHWRTDSVELAFDPRGRSENTSSTFKALVLPVTKEGPPCFGRDADNHQGGPETAPGMTVASTVTSPYTGYTVETAIPMADFPMAVDPKHLGMDLFVYDSDTQDKTGQTRIGWSTWQGVQGDPYRWGVAQLDGYTPPADRSTTPAKPVVPLTALSSLDSPPSIRQAVRDNVPLGGGPASTRAAAGWVTRAKAGPAGIRATVRANGPGTMHMFVVDEHGTAGSVTVAAHRTRHRVVTVPTTRAVGRHARVVLGWTADRGGTLSSRVPLR